MDSNDWPEVDRRKRELHKQYLEFTNQKVFIMIYYFIKITISKS